MRPEQPVSLSTFQQAVLVTLRTVIGWHFLYEGIFKLRVPGWAPPDGHPLAAINGNVWNGAWTAWSPDGFPVPAWSAKGFIEHAATGPVGALAKAAAGAGLLPVLDRLLMFGIAAVGLSLLLGLFTRAGCLGGTFLLGLFYVINVPTSGLPQTGAEGNYLLVNKTLIEAVAVLLLLAFDTGHIAGLDRLWRDRRAAAPAANRRAIGEGTGA